MPNLSMKMVPIIKSNAAIKGPVLQGQVSEWTLRISNQGNAGAEKICLKTNIPWINILHDGISIDADSTSYSTGPSGTLMQIPIRKGGINSNVLNPGETIDVPVQMRTSGGGRQDFYMLFRYQLHRDQMINPKSEQVRWLRNMVSVAVYPSLTVTASLLPSYNNRDSDHILSVEVSKHVNIRRMFCTNDELMLIPLS